MAQMAEHLPSKHKALSSNSSTTKKTKKKKKLSVCRWRATSWVVEKQMNGTERLDFLWLEGRTAIKPVTIKDCNKY
jgi:hypothetical protein